MRKTSRKFKAIPALRRIHHLKNDDIKHKIQLIYAHSLANIKKNPYQTSGVIFGIGVLSGLMVWYGMKK